MHNGDVVLNPLVPRGKKKRLRKADIRRKLAVDQGNVYAGI